MQWKDQIAYRCPLGVKPPGVMNCVCLCVCKTNFTRVHLGKYDFDADDRLLGLRGEKPTVVAFPQANDIRHSGTNDWLRHHTLSSASSPPAAAWHIPYLHLSPL